LKEDEILDLANDGKVCSSIPDYPLALTDIEATYYNGKIVACGGSTGEEITNKCFELGSDLNDWVEILPMPDGEKQCLRSSVLDEKWILSGRHNYGSEYDSTRVG